MAIIGMGTRRKRYRLAVIFAGIETADYVTAYVIKDNGDGLPLAVSDDDILAIEYIDVLA